MPRILVSYSEIWWPDSEGEYEEERGWVDEEGMEVEADPLNEMTTVDVAVRMMQDMGTTCPSSTGFHRGIWYHWHDANRTTRPGATARKRPTSRASAPSKSARSGIASPLARSDTSGIDPPVRAYAGKLNGYVAV